MLGKHASTPSSFRGTEGNGRAIPRTQVLAGQDVRRVLGGEKPCCISKQ